MIKGKKKKTNVAKSAYDNYFKNAGWHIDGSVEDLSFSDEVEESSYDENPEEDWDSVDETVEKPLSEMNRAELLEKAESMGLDVSDCTNNKQMREKIKSNM